MHTHTHPGTYMYTKIDMQTCLHKQHTHKNKDYEHMPHTHMRTHSQHTHTKMNEKKIESTSPNICLQFFLDVNTYNIYCAMVKLNLF